MIPKKNPIYGGNDLYWKLTSPTHTNVKSISSHCRQFQSTIFLRQPPVIDIFNKLLAPRLYNSLILHACSGFNVPSNRLEH